MSRKLRFEYPGAMYHVLNRGGQREDIFQDNADRQRLVHLNPVRAKLLPTADPLGSFRCSSYQFAVDRSALAQGQLPRPTRRE